MESWELHPSVLTAISSLFEDLWSHLNLTYSKYEDKHMDSYCVMVSKIVLPPYKRMVFENKHILEDILSVWPLLFRGN